eukprot:COSAG02_NODE_6178_length_3750_cov_2.117776_2_plen_85_part_00
MTTDVVHPLLAALETTWHEAPSYAEQRPQMTAGAICRTYEMGSMPARTVVGVGGRAREALRTARQCKRRGGDDEVFRYIFGSDR